MNQRLRVGILGYGYWGGVVARNLRDCGAFEIVGVCDPDAAQRGRAARELPGVALHADPRELLDAPRLDCAAIVTPARTHHALTALAIERGRHVWVEKPLAASVDEAQRLVDAAERRGVVLFVDHTFVYTGAVRRLRELHGGGALGRLRTYTSTRTNLGLVRPDVDVLWDLAAHDLSILDHALGARCLAVSATGAAHVAGAPASTAFMTAYLADGAIASVHVDWLAPEKLRRVVVVADRMLVYDDNEPRAKLRVHDLGVDATVRGQGDAPAWTYRRGDIWTPELDQGEALSAAALHFAACVRDSARPLTDGEHGLRVVRALAAASDSMARRGAPVELGGP